MDYIYKEQALNVSIDVYKGQSAIKEDFRLADLKVFLVCGVEKKRRVVEAGINDVGSITFSLANLGPGIYGVKLIWSKNDHRSPMYAELYNMFGVTEFAAEATNATADTVNIKAKLHSVTYGYDGLDAYELAVFRGKTMASEEDWLKSRGVTATVQSEGTDEESVMSQAAVTASLNQLRNLLGSAYNLIGIVNALPKTANKNDVVFLSTNKHSYVCTSFEPTTYSYWNVKSPSVHESVLDVINSLKTDSGTLVTLSDGTQQYITLKAVSTKYHAFTSTAAGEISGTDKPLVEKNNQLGLFSELSSDSQDILNIELVTVTKGDAIWLDLGELTTNNYTPEAKDTQFEPSSDGMLVDTDNVEDGLNKVGKAAPSIDKSLTLTNNLNADIINANFAALQDRYDRLCEIMQMLVDKVEYCTADGFKDIKDLISELTFGKVNLVKRVTSGGQYSQTTSVSGSGVAKKAISGTI